MPHWMAVVHLGLNVKTCTLLINQEIRSEYGSPLWSKNPSELPPTFNILGEFEQSRAEEELFMRKLKDNGMFTESFVNEEIAMT